MKLLSSLLLMVVHGVSGFQSPHHASTMATTTTSLRKHRLLSVTTDRVPRPSSSSSSASASSALYMSQTDGRETGLVLMGLVLGVCVWFFSIPPSFRRANIFCSAQDAETYEQCLTPTQFASGIADYYSSGGGIQWDFSIDPKTMQENEEMMIMRNSN